jgi:hypothetical protein
MIKDLEERRYELMSHEDLFAALVKSIKAGAETNPMTFEFDLLKRFGWLDIESAAFSQKVREHCYDRRKMTEKEEQRMEKYLSQLCVAAGSFGSFPNHRELMAESWNYARGAGTLDERALENVGDPDMTGLEMAIMGCEAVVSEGSRRERMKN